MILDKFPSYLKGLKFQRDGPIPRINESINPECIFSPVRNKQRRKMKNKDNNIGKVKLINESHNIKYTLKPYTDNNTSKIVKTNAKKVSNITIDLGIKCEELIKNVSEMS